MYSWPLTETIGSKEEKHTNQTFYTETEYLDYLKTYEGAAYMWLGHIDWQLVANKYKINVSILTTGVQCSNKDCSPTAAERVRSYPMARWTHINADSSMTANMCVPKMLILHSDESHFNLIVKNDHSIVQNGLLNHNRGETGINNEGVTKSNKIISTEKWKVM